MSEPECKSAVMPYPGSETPAPETPPEPPPPPKKQVHFMPPLPPEFLPPPPPEDGMVRDLAVALLGAFALGALAASTVAYFSKKAVVDA